MASHRILGRFHLSAQTHEFRRELCCKPLFRKVTANKTRGKARYLQLLFMHACGKYRRPFLAVSHVPIVTGVACRVPPSLNVLAGMPPSGYARPTFAFCCSPNRTFPLPAEQHFNSTANVSGILSRRSHNGRCSKRAAYMLA